MQLDAWLVEEDADNHTWSSDAEHNCYEHLCDAADRPKDDISYVSMPDCSGRDGRSLTDNGLTPD